MSTPLLNEVVEHYLSDYKVIKARYNIPNLIQLHKIAGLVACAILRFRPIVPIVDEFTRPTEIYANELLAIYHGLSICSEGSGEQSFQTDPWFGEWLNDFLYLLHRRNYSAEAVMFAFQTFSQFKFPDSVKPTEKKLESLSDIFPELRTLVVSE